MGDYNDKIKIGEKFETTADYIKNTYNRLSMERCLY